MSRFVCLFELENRATTGGVRPSDGQSMRRWMAWMHELESKGHLKERGQPLDRSGKVVRGAQRTVTDGPFIEVKDMVAGFIVVRARDVDEAAALAAGCPMLEGGGSVEVRPVLHL
jgi:hypothetical protein